MEFKLELARAIKLPWHSRDTILPHNSPDYKVLVQFNNGPLALSDGEAVHNDTSISLWKELAA